MNQPDMMKCGNSRCKNTTHKDIALTGWLEISIPFTDLMKFFCSRECLIEYSRKKIVEEEQITDHSPEGVI